MEKIFFNERPEILNKIIYFKSQSILYKGLIFLITFVFIYIIIKSIKLLIEIREKQKKFDQEILDAKILLKKNLLELSGKDLIKGVINYCEIMYKNGNYKNIDELLNNIGMNKNIIEQINNIIYKNVGDIELVEDEIREIFDKI